MAEGLLLKGGGHKMAAGLTVEEDKIEPAMARLTELLESEHAALGDPHPLVTEARAFRFPRLRRGDFLNLGLDVTFRPSGIPTRSLCDP